ncbi:hypothetical protein PHYBLDRAFT_171368 [Phycomyces blakesleeanus NRRL 1555(-)]|uniref:Uncharacterized protein n=1 Tax=Phycomyces blakesleeanus (strain ATCC 8743b / DSM 1359 / FGSC 10004 / NBRC 33097 / NRRL 1555) TaxID=763407 RepID=A0A162TXJ2_PHYB8|nr:hypothetical protein PHYBLDRAFT_171368 [Phycomyces blakesleeanus NRRL 1555(-)]OAD70623.1 hypothetical protein PHYBLDRAFT_171368 [Phycomyces blakesleeanus NRRL 1555(-)]|eukprot:XP_018288663.1 hypothetical protein PHYBLDRAFT_171368 [Phycomyces blakesleeanus NRRL 1555(-)]
MRRSIVFMKHFYKMVGSQASVNRPIPRVHESCVTGNDDLPGNWIFTLNINISKRKKTELVTALLASHAPKRLHITVGDLSSRHHKNFSHENPNGSFIQKVTLKSLKRTQMNNII